MKLIAVAGCLLIVLSGSAQLSEQGTGSFLNDINGRPLYVQTSYNSEGSPYFPEQYHLADVIALTGTVFRNVKVKVNLADNEVLYLGPDGKEMVALMPIRSIRFLSLVDKNIIADRVVASFGEQPINAPKTPLYEVLDTGRCTLLKQLQITYRDKKEFNQATVTRVFQPFESYHILAQDGSIQKLSPGKEDLLRLLKDKEAAVSAFIADNKLKCRQAADYRKVVQYYNSLF